MTDGSIKSENGGTSVEELPASVKIVTSTVDVTGNVKIKGNVQVQGNVEISGLLTLGGIVMNTHTHKGVHGLTGGPQ